MLLMLLMSVDGVPNFQDLLAVINLMDSIPTTTAVFRPRGIYYVPNSIQGPYPGKKIVVQNSLVRIPRHVTQLPKTVTM